MTVIHVFFKDLKIVVGVLFIVIKVGMKKLFSMKDMTDNALHISIQIRYVRFGRGRDPRTMDNNFLIHTCIPDVIDFAYYSKK